MVLTVDHHLCEWLQQGLVKQGGICWTMISRLKEMNSNSPWRHHSPQKRPGLEAGIAKKGPK